MHSGDDGFLGILHTSTGTGTGDGHSRVFTLDMKGHLRLGPPLPPLTGSFLVGDDPTRLVDPRRGQQIPIHPDLTVGNAEPAAIKGPRAGTAGKWVWVVHSGSDLRVEPNPYSDWYCLLSILDPVTFTLQHRVAIQSPYPEVSYDSDGRIWIVAGGLWVLDPRSPDPRTPYSPRPPPPTMILTRARRAPCPSCTGTGTSEARPRRY